MIKFKRALLLFSFVFALLPICACQACRFKIPLDYGESKWVSGEDEQIKIEMLVNADKSSYSTVTFNGKTKKYKNSFVSEMLYFDNIDENGNLVLEDGHVTGFSAYIVADSNGSISCKLNSTQFENDFLCENGLIGEYYFTLSMVKE